MWKCSDHVGLAAAAVVSNVWLLEAGGGKRFVVDTGHAAERGVLAASLWRSGVRRSGDLTAVLLTHRHTDHAGNAKWLARRFDCPLVCHENDAPFLNGEADPKPLRRGIGSPVDELLCGFEDRWPIRCPVDETFAEGPWKHGLTVFEAFGHTEGSCLIYHEPTRTLFTGDALLTGLAVTRWPRMYLAVPCYSVDVEQCHRLTTAFLEQAPPIDGLCAGHGPYLKGGVNEKLRRFRQTL